MHSNCPAGMLLILRPYDMRHRKQPAILSEQVWQKVFVLSIYVPFLHAKQVVTLLVTSHS